MAMQIKTADGKDFTYPADNAGTTLAIQRIKPGKGLRSNWFELTLSNTSGADFKLATVSFAPAPSARRI